MAIVKQKSDGNGNLKAIQELVNKHPNIVGQKIKKAFPELANDTICWKSLAYFINQLVKSCE